MRPLPQSYAGKDPVSKRDRETYTEVSGVVPRGTTAVARLQSNCGTSSSKCISLLVGHGMELRHSRDDLQVARLRRILRSYASYHNDVRNESIIGSRCAGLSPGSADREHQIVPHPWRTASPLRPGLSFPYTQGRRMWFAMLDDMRTIECRADFSCQSHA